MSLLKLPDLRPRSIAIPLTALLALFGLAHVAALAAPWWPAYGLAAMLWVATSLVLMVGAATLWNFLPRMVAPPRPGGPRPVAEALVAELEQRLAQQALELADATARLEGEIAERRHAEAVTRESEARLRRIAESLELAVRATSLGTWDVDLTTRARQWSDRYKAILGLPANATADYDRFAALIHPEDLDWVVECYRRAHEPEGGGQYRAEFRILRASDQAVRWVEATGQVFFDALGRPQRAAGTLADVTERRRAVDALRESEERYRALVDTAPDAVLVHRDGIIILANRQAVALFGAAGPADLVGRQVFSLVAEESLALARGRTALMQAPGARAGLDELTYKRLDGTRFAVEAAAVAVLVEGLLVIQVAFRDITARKQVEAALQARTAELETVLKTVPVAVWFSPDSTGRVAHGNAVASELLRIAPGANHSLSALPGDAPTHYRVLQNGRELSIEQLPMQRAVRGEVLRNEEFRVVFDDGTFFDELYNARPIRDGDGRPIGAVATATDITARKAAERSLQARTAELEAVLDTVPVAVWIAHDSEARRVSGNAFATQLLRDCPGANQSLSAPAAEAPTHLRVLKDDQVLSPEQLPMQRAVRGELVRNEDLRIVFDDGTHVDQLFSASPIRDAAGQIVGAVGAALDFTERKAAQERFRYMSLHDPLTGLANRRLFHDRLDQALARARRGGQHVALLLLDLDQFKEVNDTLGHSAGDKLLADVATRLGAVTRAGESWARLGGDEFAMLLEGLAGAVDAAPLAQRALATLGEAFWVDEHELHIGASVGLTLFPDDGDTPEELLRSADVALYRAKAVGRGRVECYRSELDDALRANRSIEQALRTAIDGGELALAFQPVFELAGSTLVKVEALLRWTRPDGSSVSPATFIPVAETSGLIHRIGRWVLDAACRQAAAWQAAGQPLKVAVNVSAAQLRQAGFAGLVEDALRGAGLRPGLLELELTETVFLDPSKEQIHATLSRIAGLGVTLAIDDFGTGYSSLAYLKHFPFDEVKIGGSFVADIGRDAGGGAIASAVVALAHGLGKRATAEGVETDEQLAFLREQGCDSAQGYLLGRPAPPEEVARIAAMAA